MSKNLAARIPCMPPPPAPSRRFAPDSDHLCRVTGGSRPDRAGRGGRPLDSGTNRAPGKPASRAPTGREYRRAGRFLPSTGPAMGGADSTSVQASTSARRRVPPSVRPPPRSRAAWPATTCPRRPTRRRWIPGHPRSSSGYRPQRRAAHAALLRCSRAGPAESADGPGRSDGEGEFGERSRHTIQDRGLGREFVVVTPQVLHERVPGGDDAQRSVSLEPAHGP